MKKLSCSFCEVALLSEEKLFCTGRQALPSGAEQELCSLRQQLLPPQQQEGETNIFVVGTV